MSDDRNLDFYLQHPEALGDLTEAQLDTLLQGGQSVTPAVAAEDAESLAATESEPEEDTPPATEEAEAAPAEEAKAEDAEPVVLTKDGKHTIPYTELEAARTEAKMLKQTVTNLNETIRQLQERVESGAAQAGDKTPDEMIAELMPETDLKTLEEDFPEIGKVVRSQQAVISKLLQDVTTLADARERDQQQSVATTIQTVIDANPQLSWLQKNDPDGFARAVEFDDMLKTKAEWQGMEKVPDRFNKVVALYQAMYGEIPVPQPADKPAPAKADAPAPRKGAQKPQAPVSLSQIPGGEPPAVDSLGAVESTSGARIVDWFHGKTPEQIWARIDRMM